MTKQQSIIHIKKQQEIESVEKKINETDDPICKNRLEQMLFHLERELEDIENEK